MVEGGPGRHEGQGRREELIEEGLNGNGQSHALVAATQALKRDVLEIASSSDVEGEVDGLTAPWDELLRPFSSLDAAAN